MKQIETCFIFWQTKYFCICLLFQKKNFGKVISFVSRIRDADGGLIPAIVQNIFAVSRRQHPAMDGIRAGIVEALSKCDVFADCPPVSDAEQRSAVVYHQTVQTGVTEKFKIRHTFRMSARDFC